MDRLREREIKLTDIRAAISNGEIREGESNMTCFFCKSNMNSGTTTYVADLGDTIIIIRNVPCQKCPQCEQTAYDLGVAERLEQIVDSLKSSLTEVAIVHYSEKAA